MKTEEIITDALLVSDNSDRLFLAVMSNQGCEFLAEFTGNEFEAGVRFAGLKAGLYNLEEIRWNWAEGDLVAACRRSWIEQGRECTSLETDRDRVLNGWEGCQEDELPPIPALDANGGARLSIHDQIPENPMDCLPFSICAAL